MKFGRRKVNFWLEERHVRIGIQLERFHLLPYLLNFFGTCRIKKTID